MVLISLTVVLTPLVTAIAINEGLKSEYARVLGEGGDVYVTRDNYGSNAPIELAVCERIKAIQGVTQVIPRVIGRTYAHGKLITVLGIDSDRLPPSLKVSQGRKAEQRGEVLLGFRVAQYLNAGVGSSFSLEINPGKVFRIVGLFDSAFTIWSADLMVMGFQDACELFSMPDKATDLVVYTRPGYPQIVEAIIRMSEQSQGDASPPLRAQTKGLIERYTRRGFDLRAGVFASFYCMAMALAIPCLGVISGFGLNERRKEIGVIKALGWQTREVLESVALENLALSLCSVPVTMLASLVWIHALNGVGLVTFLIPNIGIIVPFPVPSRACPVALTLVLVLAPTLTMVGSVYWTWRTAIILPATAMKA